MTKKRVKRARAVPTGSKKKSVADFDRLIAEADFEGVREAAIPFIDALLKKTTVKNRTQVRRRLLNALNRAIILYAKNKRDRSGDGNFLLYYSAFARDVLDEARG